MPALQTTTPQRTVSIKSFVAYLTDGRIIQVVVDGGEGFFRQQTIKGKERTISTHECFVANGRWKLLNFFKGGEMSTEENDVPEDDEPEEDDDE